MDAIEQIQIQPSGKSITQLYILNFNLTKKLMADNYHQPTRIATDKVGWQPLTDP